MKIFEFALKMEENGKAYYEKLAKTAQTKGLQAIFTELAMDEQKHYDIFKAMLAGQEVYMADSMVLEKSRNIFSTLLADKTAMVVSTSDLEAYRYAMKLEVDSFRLYEEAAAKESNTDVKVLLLRIAGEEHKHFNILENIYAFVNAPNQYLAWGEFSNLEEFRNFGRDVGR
ncbi:MAG: hypothetical protein A2091_00505 [Desulfuromonadales bacterium GWD2_61_12]|nr:MAG: hypothetical protein A2005_08530 [Desulfuromonadales bacterium GWC2_61_20]OGR32746.1 MAG: hypothetical protein A2091_00505 [Desulfuromonadales bacterium GWD2_61_12]HAD03160.1 ferritin [Desulfuromonas sp.]HBT83344.1 ferritin [Desulfuromonas sp.]